MKGAFVIDVRECSAGGREYDFPVSPEWLAAQLEGVELARAPEAGSLHLAVSPAGRSFYVKGRVRVGLAMPCVRCLKETAVALDVHLSMVLARGSSDIGEALGEGEEPPGVVLLAGDEAVLDGEVREAILLELPMNPRCAEECSTEELYR